MGSDQEISLFFCTLSLKQGTGGISVAQHTVNGLCFLLEGYSPWDRQESETTERLHFHFSLSCIGEGNGNPLQCSCLENPSDGGAWWAAVYGVAQSRTRLKRLSSSSSSLIFWSTNYRTLQRGKRSRGIK